MPGGIVALALLLAAPVDLNWNREPGARAAGANPDLRAPAAVLRGPARALDGATLLLAGERVRLVGIAAPRPGQLCEAGGRPWPCGEVATAVLWDLIAGHELRCEVEGRDDDGRVLAVCYVGHMDVNAQMVVRGYAIARYPGPGKSAPDYEPLELRARQAGRGIWRGSFALPWE